MEWSSVRVTSLSNALYQPSHLKQPRKLTTSPARTVDLIVSTNWVSCLLIFMINQQKISISWNTAIKMFTCKIKYFSSSRLYITIEVENLIVCYIEQTGKDLVIKGPCSNTRFLVYNYKQQKVCIKCQKYNLNAFIKTKRII